MKPEVVAARGGAARACAAMNGCSQERAQPEAGAAKGGRSKGRVQFRAGALGSIIIKKVKSSMARSLTVDNLLLQNVGSIQLSTTCSNILK